MKNWAMKASGTEVNLEVGQEFSSISMRQTIIVMGTELYGGLSSTSVYVCVPGSISHTFNYKYLTIK